MSALKLTFLSHGTLEARELDKTRQFYEECLGLETIRTSPISLMIRLGGDNTIAVVQNPKKGEMALLNHNGLDVATRAEVDECHRILSEGKEKWA
ncbi:MAG: VOC family protein [Betaproteobacteria bacterium]|nr:MAG: VOC family protein [Betaproteobacteria bacterium]